MPRPLGAPAAADQLRRHNTALVLRTLRDAGPASRAEIAVRSGLAKATVGTIVGALLGAGVLRDHVPPTATAAPDGAAPAPLPARQGRPGRPVTLDGGRLAGLGVEVNVDYLAAVALDLSGETRLVEEHPVDAPDVSDVVRFVGGCRDRLLGAGLEVLGVTVAVPGLVDRERGRVTSAPNLGWSGLDLAGAVATAIGPGCPIGVDNDANCAALAEADRGAGVGTGDLVYLTGTVGLGAGMVVADRIVRGARGYAGEVGHLAVGGSTAVCACGRTGCWEAQIGLRAMLAAVGRPELEAAGDPVEVATQVAALADSDPTVRAGLQEIAERLARGVAMLVTVLDPRLVVLGGAFVPLGPWLLPAVEEALRTTVFAPRSGGCTVELSRLGLHAASTGAAAAVLSEVFAGTVALP